MDESFPTHNSIENHESEPSTSEKVRMVFDDTLEKFKEFPSVKAAMVLFVIASADHAAAQEYGNTDDTSFVEENYSTFSNSERLNVPGLSEVIHLSPNIDDFNEAIATGFENATNAEKVAFLQDLGGRLAAQYDYDMLADFETVNMSAQEMLDALRTGESAGVCGNIHIFIAAVGKQMGLETWVQAGDKGPSDVAGGHTFTGVILKNEGGQEIVWIDYNDVIYTGTDNYKEALGAYEHKNATRLFPDAVAGEASSLIDSEAQEALESITGETPTTENNNFVQDGIEVNLSKEIKTFSIKPGGTMYIRYGGYTNESPDEYNPLISADYIAAGVGGRVIDVEGASLDVQGEIGNLHMRSNNTQVGETEVSYLLGQIMYEGALTGKTRLELEELSGQISYRLHALGHIKGGVSFGETTVDQYTGIRNSSGESSYEIGGTVYFNPDDNDNSFFLGASEEVTIAADSLDTREITTWRTGTSISAGATINGQRGTYEIAGRYTDGVDADSIDFSTSFNNEQISHNFSLGYTEMDASIPGNNPSESKVSYEWSNGQDSLTLGFVGEDGEVVEANILFERKF